MSVASPHQLREAMRDWLGDRFYEYGNWQGRTTAGGWDAHGVLHHWTAMSGRSISVSRQLEVLAHGYEGLPGPLCHFAPTRGGRVYAVGFGNCNHAGDGDPDVVRAIIAGTYDGSFLGYGSSHDGNPDFYGLEYMYHPDDGPMPDEQIEAGILTACAIAQAHGWTDPDTVAGSNCDHFEFSAADKWDRKRDNLANRTRAGIRTAMRGGSTGGDDVSQKDVLDALRSNEGQKLLGQAAWQYNIPSGKENNPEWWAETFLKNIEAATDRGNIHDAVWNGDDIPNLVNQHHGDGKNPTQHPKWAVARGHLDAYEAKAEAREDRVTTGAPSMVLLREIAKKVDAPVEVDEAELAASLLPGLLAGLADRPAEIARLVSESLPENLSQETADLLLLEIGEALRRRSET